jgi:hypothetical protein
VYTQDSELTTDSILMLPAGTVQSHTDSESAWQQRRSMLRMQRQSRSAQSGQEGHEAHRRQALLERRKDGLAPVLVVLIATVVGRRIQLSALHEAARSALAEELVREPRHILECLPVARVCKAWDRGVGLVNGWFGART